MYRLPLAATRLNRHAFGDQYKATDFVVPGPGKLEMTYTPAGGGAPVKYEIFNFDGAGETCKGCFSCC